MAEVHLAEERMPGAPARLVVVKRLHQHHQDDELTVRMFLDEARLLRRLSHPNIVTTEREGVFEGRHGIVMEFLEGQPLHHVLKRAYEVEGELSAELVAHIAVGALSGLHYAHELCDTDGTSLGVVHRDVSPHNLLLTYDGEVKLLDFGIAKNVLQDGRTCTGMLKGKVSYMAPEQARGEVVDRRADLWSLGVVLWEAITGSRLFKAESEAATLNLTLTAAVPPPSSRREDVPAELEVILMRALKRRSEERYATADAMRAELEAWLDYRRTAAKAALSRLMQRLFSREIHDQRQQIQNLLAAPLDVSPESGVTLRASSTRAPNASPLLPASELSSVTDLLTELTKQRRATTRLLLVLLVVLGAVVVFALASLYSGRGPAEKSATSTTSVREMLTRPPAAPAASPRHLAEESTPSAAAPPPERAPVASASAPAPATRRSHRVSLDAVPAPRPSTTGPALAPPRAAPEAPAQEMGLLSLDTTPWAHVTVAGRSLGTTPLVRVSLPVGTHTLVLQNPELGLKTLYPVTISAGKTTSRRVGLE